MTIDPASPPTLDPAIHAFYRDRYREDDRLSRTAHGRLEYLRTRELLGRYLPPAPAEVLDVGGATGVHARWLLAEGYGVHLIDPVPEHVAHAATIGGLAATIGDARALPVPDGAVDVTLLLGPLYHLVDAGDRALALREAARATRPGGLVAAAAISRYAGLLELAAVGEIDDETAESLRRGLRTGVNEDEPDGFTTAYFHGPGELAAEFTAAGLTDVVVLGIEGPSTPALDAARPERLPELLPSALWAARALEQDPAMMYASPHQLAVGRVPGAP